MMHLYSPVSVSQPLPISVEDGLAYLRVSVFAHRERHLTTNDGPLDGFTVGDRRLIRRIGKALRPIGSGPVRAIINQYIITRGNRPGTVLWIGFVGQDTIVFLDPPGLIGGSDDTEILDDTL